MKKITLLAIVLLTYQILISQSVNKIDYFNWSDPNTFQLSPSPVVHGYGFYSDSLAKLHDGKTFYEHNGEYYSIESWADYYYWFTQAYRHLFEDPQLYEYYYFTNDNYGMASYIAGSKYLGKYYPSTVQINFADMQVDNNRLSTNDYFTENDTKKVEMLNKQLESKKTKTGYSETEKIKRKEAPEIFNKENSKKNRLESNPYMKESPEDLNTSKTKSGSKDKSIR
ncbi:hypothetical protein ACFLS4_01335 [Bacteroidota bacterium]